MQTFEEFYLSVSLFFFREYVETTLFSYRTSQHESTKATPFDALYMRKNSLPWQKKRALVVDFRHHQVHLFTLQKQIIYAQSETGQRTAERTVAL